MSSLPYSILLKQQPNILPISSIIEHQKFCKKFIKAHQTFEKYKNNSKNKVAFINNNVYLLANKDQNQSEILDWFNSLQQEEKLSIFSIKNLWLTKQFTQMIYIFYKMGNYNYKPILDMCVFFKEQKNYIFKEESKISFSYISDILAKWNIPFNSNTITESSNNVDNNKDINEYKYDELNLFSNFWEYKEIIDTNYLNSEKREMEKNFIDNIRIISSEKDIFDTITFTKDFILNIDNIKKYFNFFSAGNFFKDWIIPINVKNVYNFVLPSWMHVFQELSLCQIIMGYFEQKILIYYEYYYYTGKIMENPYDKQILEIYNENLELKKYISNHYSFDGSGEEKEEILLPETLTKITDELRGSEKFHQKIGGTKDLFKKICPEKAFYVGKEISFDEKFSLEIYNFIKDELTKEKNNWSSRIVDIITFIKVIDIINYKDNTFLEFRKNLLKAQENSIVEEIQSSGFLSKKKKKNKKKKKKNENENKIKNDNISKRNLYDVLTKEVECEYNMSVPPPKINMIQETATNICINSNNKNNVNSNNIFIQGRKKSGDKNIEKPENNDKKEEKKEEISKIELKEGYKKEEDKKEEKKEVIKEDIKIEKIEDKKEDKKEEKEIIQVEKVKEKHKKKEFFLYPINKKNKKENNNNNINEPKVGKGKNKHKKKNKNTKEEIIIDNTSKTKNNNTFNYVQERKNIVQINPCPRRKKKIPFQTSSINFEMRMNPPPIDTSYPYYYSFPMMKPFTSLSEVSTIFSFPSVGSEGNQNKKNTQNHNKPNTNKINNDYKIHWNYTKVNHNNNNNNSIQMFNSHVPSEKYFKSLNNELDNYLLVTSSNISKLKNIYEKYMNKVENLLQNSLSKNFDIKFGHYGSFFSDLSIEGSDLDILVYYQKKTESKLDFYNETLNVLQQKKENNFESIYPIPSASVPIIKLQIDIKNEIKDLNLESTSYYEEEEITKIKIDLSFTESEQEYQHSSEIISYIKKSLSEYPQIKPMLLVLKRYFKEMKMNKSYTGGLCSFSLFLLTLSFCKYNKQCESPSKLLYYFMENFTYFDYCNYFIDVEQDNCYILKDKAEKIIEKSISDENSSYDTNYELYDKEEIYIKDPISKLNVSKSSFRVDEIILTFRKGFNLLYYEGWYYDFCPSDKNSEKKIVEKIDEIDKDNSSDYMTIKKLFGLQSLIDNFDFYFN